MDEELFNKVHKLIREHPKVEKVIDEGIEESNKIITKRDIGGCYKKKFRIEPANDNVFIDDFVIDMERIIRKQHRGLLMRNDKPQRMIAHHEEWQNGEPQGYIYAYVVPNPQ